MIGQIACESSPLSRVNWDVYLGEMASQMRKKNVGWDLTLNLKESKEILSVIDSGEK